MKPCLGIFDSGVGGFTVLKQVLVRHRHVNCLYLADTARVPYGEKTPQEIRVIAEEVVEWLCEQNVSAILIACNTTNSLAFDIVNKVANVPVIGLINAAGLMLREERIGVLATTATAASSAYMTHIQRHNPNAVVIEEGCPELVPLIEADDLEVNKVQDALLQHLEPLLQAKVEAIILGCSHYPLVESFLLNLLPDNVRLVNPAKGLACQLDFILGQPEIYPDSLLSYENTRICSTSDPHSFARQANKWLGVMPSVEFVSLRSKACFF